MAFLNETRVTQLLQRIAAKLSGKVDKVNGMGLSTNDYTNAEKTKLAGIADGANKTTIDTSLSVSGQAADAKAVGDALAGKQEAGDYVLETELGALAKKNTVAKTDLASAVQTSLGKADTALQSYTETDPTVPNWAKAASKPTYTASEVGADPSGTATSAVSTHNTATDAHNDIRLLVEGLTTRLNTLADSDDTTLDQMSEVVAYIKSNKGLIDSITTSKVNVSDIINNLTTNVTDKPLSAAQGVALKALIDNLTASDVGAAASTHNQAASTITEGIFAGMVKANAAAMANLTEPQVRNSVTVTNDPGEGVALSYPIGTEITVV